MHAKLPRPTHPWVLRLDRRSKDSDQRIRCRVIVADFGGKLHLHFLPPYCPDEDRIERRWLDLNANVTRTHQ